MARRMACSSGLTRYLVTGGSPASRNKPLALTTTSRRTPVLAMAPWTARAPSAQMVLESPRRGPSADTAASAPSSAGTTAAGSVTSAVITVRFPLAGTPTRDWLVATAGAAITFYLKSFPMSASMFAEPDLLAAHRADMAHAGAGPHLPAAAVAGYLRAEQDRGRTSSAADSSAAADLLIGACFQYAFLCCFAGRQPTQDEIDTQAASAVGALPAGVAALPQPCLSL